MRVRDAGSEYAGFYTLSFNRPLSSCDFNGNGAPDAEDLARGSSVDRNRDGVPDECQELEVFVRGEVSGDGRRNLTDAVVLLNFLFGGGSEPACLDAADIDDSGAVNLTDAVFLLNFLFLGATEPPAPGPFECAPDPTADCLDCGSFDSCDS